LQPTAPESDNLAAAEAAALGGHGEVMKRTIRILFLAAATMAAASGGHLPPYPRLQNVSRIIVQIRPSQMAVQAERTKTIDDPARIAPIVAFVNERRDGWQRPWYGVQASRVVADFYSGGQFLGHVASGPGFLETQRMGDFACRPASAAEVAAFNGLLGLAPE
jgi:hypothetical protein